MRVVRGRAETVDADRAVTGELLADAADGERAVRVWTPHRQVAFGRRDARSEGYDAARSAAEAAGFPPVERAVGGRAVAYDGETTLAFLRAEPIADFRRGTDERYERLTADVARALETLGVAVECGEPPRSFCPGSHSLQVREAVTAVDPSDASDPPDATDERWGKIAGIAQRVTADAAVVAGVLVVANRGELAAVLESVYDPLGVPFDPGTVGSVAAGSGPSDPARVRDALEDALVGEMESTVERID